MKFVATAAIGAVMAAATETPAEFVAPKLGMRLRDVNKAVVPAEAQSASTKRMAKGGGKKGKWKDRTVRKRNGFAVLTNEDESLNSLQRIVFPIGQCYETEYDGVQGSEEVYQFEIFDDYFTATIRWWNESSTCEDDDYVEDLFSGDIAPYVPTHQKSLNKALKLPDWADSGSTVYSTYYTSSGCDTTAGRYYQIANGCVTFTNETLATDDDYSLTFSCNTTDNSRDMTYFPSDTCDGTGFYAGSTDGDMCTDESSGGDVEFTTFECDDGSSSAKSPKAPKSPKEPKEPKSPKEPKEPKAPKAASILERVTGFVSSFMGSKKLR